MNTLPRLMTRGLQPGKLPFRLAHLKIGESLFVETTKKDYGKVVDRLRQGSQATAIQHMQFSPRVYIGLNVHDSNDSLYVVKITRLEDKEFDDA